MPREQVALACRRMCVLGVPAETCLRSMFMFYSLDPAFPFKGCGESQDFIFLVLLASWMDCFDLPWDHQPTLDVLEYFAGVSRVAKCAMLAGYQSRAFDIEFDNPPEGESSHSNLKKRSAFDFCGEAGFMFLFKIGYWCPQLWAKS